MNATWWNAPQDERFNEPGQESDWFVCRCGATVADCPSGREAHERCPDVEGMAREYVDKKAEGLSLKLHDMARDDLIYVIEELWDAIYNKEWSEPPDSIEAVLVRWDLSWHQIKVRPESRYCVKCNNCLVDDPKTGLCGHCSTGSTP